MAQDEKGDNTREKPEELLKRNGTSKKVTDHLANERTFLAWIRTGLATITFGFVVARFGLLLRQLGAKSYPIFNVSTSLLVGVTLTILGVVILIVALVSFLQIRRSIDREEFHPAAGFSIVLTILTALIGIILAVYLVITG